MYGYSNLTRSCNEDAFVDSIMLAKARLIVEKNHGTSVRMYILALNIQVYKYK